MFVAKERNQEVPETLQRVPLPMSADCTLPEQKAAKSLAYFKTQPYLF